MKSLLAAVLLAVFPTIVLAQAKPADPKPAAAAPKPASAAAPKAAKPPVKAKSAGAAKPPALARSALKAVEEVTPIDEDLNMTLTPAELEIAKTVYVGEMKCELGASVLVRPARREGFFMVITKGARFMMHPVESRTGAIRLEDPRRGAMWLQLGNKSMLMSQKQGHRLADECQGPEQVTRAEYLKNNPMPGLLDGQRPGMMGPGPGMGPMHRHGESADAPAVPEPSVAVPAAAAPAPAAAPAASAPTGG
ncbi:MAG: hypothetical protein V4609_08190 [Pseudomonadota bacterium]